MRRIIFGRIFLIIGRKKIRFHPRNAHKGTEFFFLVEHLKSSNVLAVQKKLHEVVAFVINNEVINLIYKKSEDYEMHISHPVKSDTLYCFSRTK